MSSTTATSNITSGFIDLATYDEIDKYFYGGESATAYFVRRIEKATWFTIIPSVLNRSSGSPDFNQEWSVRTSRGGDYMLQNWLRIQMPEVSMNTQTWDPNLFGIRWTRNLGHNIIRECSLSFNDLTEARFDNYHMDFWTAFTVPAGKRIGYNNMIGNVPQLVDPYFVGNLTGVLPTYTLNIPLILPHTRDTGVALPTAALPYNEISINFVMRDWTELLIFDSFAAGTSRPAQLSDLSSGVPVLSTVQVWAEFAIVSNDERKRMGKSPRDIGIEQVQTAPPQSFTPLTISNPRYDIRLSHSVKVLFFSVRNTTNMAEWSNYTAASPVPSSAGVNFAPLLADDPVLQASLIYENTARLQNLGADYYSLVQPWYHAPVIPTETGYHSYSYAFDFIAVDPLGSTNYGKLVNVSVDLNASPSALTAAGGGQPPNTGAALAQRYQFVLTAVNHNVVRISGGALGFPVL